MGASVVATFVQDVELVEVAALPCVRELRPLGGGWHPIEGPQLARQLERAAATARRLFHDAVRPIRIEASFNVARGSVGGCDGLLGGSGRHHRHHRAAKSRRARHAAVYSAGRCRVRSIRRGHGGPKSDSKNSRTDRGRDIGAGRSEHPLRPCNRCCGEGEGDRARSFRIERAMGRSSELAEACGVRVEAGPAIQEPLDVVIVAAEHLARLNERLLVMSRAAVIDRGGPDDRIASPGSGPIDRASRAFKSGVGPTTIDREPEFRPRRALEHWIQRKVCQGRT